MRAILAASLLIAACSGGVCYIDTDCKGDRVCYKSECVGPLTIAPDMVMSGICVCAVDDDCRGFNDPRGSQKCTGGFCSVCPPVDDAGESHACIGEHPDAGICYPPTM